MHEREPDGAEFKPLLDAIGENVNRKIALETSIGRGALYGTMINNVFLLALKYMAITPTSYNESTISAGILGIATGSFIAAGSYGWNRYKAKHFDIAIKLNLFNRFSDGKDDQ